MGKSAELILVLDEVLVSFRVVVIIALYSELFVRVEE